MTRKKKNREKAKGISSKKKPFRRVYTHRSPSPSNVREAAALAMRYYEQGEYRKAEKICSKILENNPIHGSSLNLLGLIAHDSGEAEGAEKLLAKAIKSEPNNPVYYFNLGIALQTQGKLNEAIVNYRTALRLNPSIAGAHYNMGIALQEQGKVDAALACFYRVIELEPNYPEAHNNIGVSLARLSRFDEAISSFRRAVALQPNNAEAWFNLGNACTEQGRLDARLSRFDEAISSFRRAVALQPNNAEAYFSLGNAFSEQDESDEAISCFRRSLTIKPDYVSAMNQLLMGLQRTCAWEEMGDLVEKIDEATSKVLVGGARTLETPFISFARRCDPSHNFAIAKSWSSDIAKSVSNLNTNFSFHRRKTRKKRLAVGYLSSDFFDHPTAHLMLSLFGLHNRNEFQIFCYSYGQDDGSHYRERIRRDSDRFVDLRTKSHADAAQQIYEDQVDILVDLKGHTRHNRLEICALRPAPIQVSYLGFPGTTGADFIDYLITDRIVTPVAFAPYYSEQFVYLPNSYQVNDHTQAISPSNWMKSDFGLQKSSFVFSSFNQAYKIEPVIFDAWMHILRQVPESALWLQVSNETARKNLVQEAETRGIEGDRLVFAEKLPKDKHLARLKLSDLALDTRIVNGHTTTSDALWVGVPVITMQGTHFASRVSSSILTAIGLPELIADSLEEYQALAVRLAHNPDELKATRDKLKKNRLLEPLFDTPRFVRNLEKAYKEMWEIFLAGRRPRQIEVMED